MRDSARGEVRELRARVATREGELRAALQELDVVDEAALGLRRRLQAERARGKALDAALAEQEAELLRLGEAGAAGHRLLGICLILLFVMGVRLFLGPRQRPGAVP